MSATDLREIQRRFFGFVRRRLGDDYRLEPLPEEGELSTASLRALVKPNDRLSCEERIELYARQYWFRLIDSFREDFPGVAALVGSDVFHDLTLDYLEAHPSRTYTLRCLGRDFPLFVERGAASVPGPLRSVVLDMARLEWAKMEVFDAAELPALTPDEALEGDILTLPIGLQPHLRLLRLEHPVDDWLVRLRREEWRAEASNAVAADGPQADAGDARAAERMEPPGRRTTRVVVHRHDEMVFFKRQAPEAFHLLEAFARGRPLGDALETLVPSSSRSLEWWRGKLRTLFAEWTALRWLVRRAGHKEQQQEKEANEGDRGKAHCGL